MSPTYKSTRDPQDLWTGKPDAIVETYAQRNGCWLAEVGRPEVSRTFFPWDKVSNFKTEASILKALKKAGHEIGDKVCDGPTSYSESRRFGSDFSRTRRK